MFINSTIASARTVIKRTSQHDRIDERVRETHCTHMFINRTIASACTVIKRTSQHDRIDE